MALWMAWMLPRGSAPGLDQQTTQLPRVQVLAMIGGAGWPRGLQQNAQMAAGWMLRQLQNPQVAAAREIPQASTGWALRRVPGHSWNIQVGVGWLHCRPVTWDNRPLSAGAVGAGSCAHASLSQEQAVSFVWHKKMSSLHAAFLVWQWWQRLCWW